MGDRLLVDIEYGRGVAMRLVHFYQEARKLLGVKVEVVARRGIELVYNGGG